MRRIVVTAALCAAYWASIAAAQEVQTDESGVRAVFRQHTPSNDADDDALPRTAGWQAIGPFGGDAFDVAVSPVDPNVVLAGLHQPYRSTDGGQTWAQISAPVADVEDIEFAPGGLCYLATTDSVWKSTNNGVSFTRIDMGLGLNTAAHRLTIDPQNPAHLWVGVDDHLGFQTSNVMYSPDGGVNWQNRTPPIGTPMACRSIAVNPLDSNKIYAAFGGAFGGGQFWFSDDGGFNWSDHTAGLPTRPEKDVVSDGTNLYVTGGQLFGSQTFGLFRSTDDGLNWTALHDGSWPILAHEDIELDPANNQIIYLTSLGAGLYKSIDGGATWSFGIGGTGGVSVNSVRLAPGNSNRVFLGASSLAVLQSSNAGANFAITANGIGLLSLFSVAANPLNGQELAVAFQGDNNGGVYTSVNGGQTWQVAALPGTRFNYVAFSPTGVLFAISNGPTTVGAEGIYRRNGDQTWTPLGPDVGPLFETDLDTICFSMQDPNLMVASGGDFGVAGFEPTIWRTTNGGTSWDKVLEMVGRNGHVRDLARVQDGTDQIVLGSLVDNSGSNQGGALRSINGGVTWAGAVHGLNPLFSGAALATSPDDPFTFYLANQYNPGGGPPGGGLFKTTNAGDAWVPAGFPGHVVDVLVDPQHPNTLYLMNNTQRALKSVDYGATAQAFTEGLAANAFLRQISYAPGAIPRLLAATNAGAYARDLAFLPGDTNCSGAVNVSDIPSFALALTNPAGYQAAFPSCSLTTADVNNDGLANGLDVAPFVALLVGP